MTEITQRSDSALQAQREQERRWHKMTTHHVALLQELVDDLRRRRTRPNPPTHYGSYEDDLVGTVKEYFHHLRKLVPPNAYRQLVDRFEQANLEYLKLPAVQRQSFPLTPPMKSTDLQSLLCIKDMPVLSETTPHTGGRRLTPSVQRRDARIRELWKNAPAENRANRALYVCQQLDIEKWPTPWKEFRSWEKALTDPLFKNRASVLISKAL